MNTSPGWELIKAERQRQIEKGGFDAAHDSQHHPSDLAAAAFGYLGAEDHGPVTPPSDWPWDPMWWKPKDRLRNLVRAGALYLAASDCADTFKWHTMAKALRDEAITCSHLIHAEKLA